MRDDGYVLFGAEALLKRLQALDQERDGVRKAEDIECVHRMRVASRRLRSALSLFADCLPPKRQTEWLKQVRRITGALGAARDVDVQIEFLQAFASGLPDPRHRSGIERLLLRLGQRRRQLQAQVLDALGRLDESRTLDEMAQSLRQAMVQARLRHAEPDSPALRDQSFLTISLRLEEMLAFRSYVQHPDRVQELHAMRIAAKRLRYTMEIFAPLYADELKKPLQTVRKVQEMLGDIHDCDVWVQYLPQFLEEERVRTEEYFGHGRSMRRLASGLTQVEQERRSVRDTRYREFVALWGEVESQGVWKGLGQALLAPPQADGAKPRGAEAAA